MEKPFKIIVVATSAGGVEALIRILSPLPKDLRVPVVAVLHLSKGKSLIVDILRRHLQLEVKFVEQTERVQAGIVYMAPPGKHVRINGDSIALLTEEDPVHYTRPAADPLFISAAERYREGVIAVVLTGTGRDGAMGAKTVKKHGGYVIIQDLESAAYSGMPASAIKADHPDVILPLSAIAGEILRLV